jgi:hypothetical protein
MPCSISSLCSSANTSRRDLVAAHRYPRSHFCCALCQSSVHTLSCCHVVSAAMPFGTLGTELLLMSSFLIVPCTIIGSCLVQVLAPVNTQVHQRSKAVRVESQQWSSISRMRMLAAPLAGSQSA